MFLCLCFCCLPDGASVVQVLSRAMLSSQTNLLHQSDFIPARTYCASRYHSQSLQARFSCCGSSSITTLQSSPLTPTSARTSPTTSQSRYIKHPQCPFEPSSTAIDTSTRGIPSHYHLSTVRVYTIPILQTTESQHHGTSPRNPSLLYSSNRPSKPCLDSHLLDSSDFSQDNHSQRISYSVCSFNLHKPPQTLLLVHLYDDETWRR
jgi:hypothetical protein